ncbi:g1749 [Coccomyxa elongata]
MLASAGIWRKVTTSALQEDGHLDFDLFTIGGGSAGVRAARYSAGLGAKVGLCELPRALISSDDKGGTGGTCVLRGCVPKKLMALAGLFAEELQDAASFGWEVKETPQLSWEALQNNKRRELERLSDLYRDNLEKADVKFIEGRARIVDPNTVEVNGQQYKAKNILVATGSAAIIPPIEGGKDFAITSDHILNLDELPRKLVVVGGGYIGCEQASIFNNFGTEVHLIVRQELPLAGFDREACAFVMEQYKLRGLHYYGQSSPTKVFKGPNGKLTVRIEPYKRDGDPFEIEDVDQVLMATGRKPKTQNIGLEDVGAELDEKGGLKVDEYSRSVNVPSIWGIGDVTNRIPLTPVARMEGSALAMHLFGEGNGTKPDYTAVPSVVFSSPQLAYVGKKEDAAVEEYQDVDVYTSTSTPMKNTLGRRDVKELVKVIVSSKDDRVIGFHMVGSEASEIMQGFAAALYAGITKRQLDATVGIHPSSAEEFVTMTKPSRKYRGGKLTEGEPLTC